MTSTLLSLRDSWTTKKIRQEKIYQQQHSLRGCALPAYNLHYIQTVPSSSYKHMHAEKKNRKLMIVYSKTDEKQSTRTRTN
jgi:hypothetical protein